MTSPGVAKAEECDLALDQTRQVIQKVQEHQRQIQEYRNTSAAISILPDDVLAHLFVLCAPSWGSQQRRTHIAFSHVCRRWRRVSLQNPRGWSQIDFALPRLALAMLERVKDAPLSLKMDMTPLEPLEPLKLISGVFLQKHANLRDVHLSGQSSILRKILAQMVSPMPHLSSLTLISEDYAPHGWAYTELRCPALEKFTAPQFRQLFLLNCSIPWSSQCFGHLTELRMFLERTDSLSIPELFLAIARNPLLKILYLGISGDWHPSAQDSAVGCTTMERLTSLVLMTTTPLLIHTLGRLALPNLRFLKVQDLGVCSTQSEMTSLVSAICERYTAQFDVRTIKLSEVNIGDDIHLRVAVNEPMFFFLPVNELDADPTFVGTFQLAEDILGHLVGNESHSLQLCESLRNVPECSILSSVPEESWPAIRDCISTLPCLDTLTVAGEPFYIILELLEDSDWGSSATCLFPSLRTLRLVDAPLDEDLPEEEKHVEATGLRRLVIALSKIRDCGRPLPTVILVTCNYKRGDDPIQIAAEFGLSDTIMVRREP